MIDKFFEPIFAPFRKLRGEIFKAKQMPQNLKGGLNRVKSEAGQIRGEVSGAAGSAKGAGAKAQGAAGQLKSAGAQKAPQAAKKPGKKMGLFSRKKKCAGCGQAVHPSWEECPYCGFGKPAPAVGGSGGEAAPAGGAQRTMALDLGAGAAPAGTGMLGWFIPLEGSKAGELFPLRGRVTVGTAADNDVVVPEASISGHHCEFVGNATGFKINDLGSTNGTFVNDKRVQSHDLIDNDNVMLGRIRFKFKSLY